MSKSNHYKSFVTATIVLLIIPALSVLNVKAQTTPTSGNWSQVATFTGESSGNTDSFTCDHVEWRIRWEADIMDLHFYFTDYFLQITTFPEGSINYYIDFINGSFSSISDSGDRVSGTSYIHDHAGSFYMRIMTSTHTENYRVIVEQNTNSPILSPTPTPIPTPTLTPTPSTSPTPTPLPPIRFYNPYLILFASTLLLIVLGVLAYYKKYKGRS